MTPTEILTLADLQALVRQGVTNWSAYGNVRVIGRRDLLLFSYTQHAQFENRWNPFELMSRGLVLQVGTGKIIARPFSKFFNYGERLPHPAARLIDATEKADGSLAVAFHHHRTWNVSTTGSLNSSQALWAQARLNSGIYDLSVLNPDYTYLFEAIYPENRIVVDYGDRRDLVLLACIEKQTGNDVVFAYLRGIAADAGFGLPHYYAMSSAEDYLELASKLSANEEGFVLRYNDGSRFKIKGDAYRLAHKMLTGVSFKHVLEATAAGTLDEWLAGVPDEFLTVIKGYQEEIRRTVDLIYTKVEVMMNIAPMGQSRKEFALWVKFNCADIAPYMFLAFDHKELIPAIYANAFKNKKETE